MPVIVEIILRISNNLCYTNLISVPRISNHN